MRWTHQKETEEREAKHKEQLKKAKLDLEAAIRTVNEDVARKQEETERKMKGMVRDNTNWKKKLDEATKKLEEEREEQKKAKEAIALLLKKAEEEIKQVQEQQRLHEQTTTGQLQRAELERSQLSTKILELSQQQSQLTQDGEGERGGAAEGSSSKVNGKEKPTSQGPPKKKRRRAA
eukprot:GHVU01124990.1.p1 GENE.GHVU01124990.1~~GHVU01124990.1.p1  ORF type:complete len:177 (+),score=71.00 GHVU01124990.1:335-865(+)